MSEQTLYNYSLASTGGFVKSALVYFEKCIDKKPIKAGQEKLPGEEEEEDEEAGLKEAGDITTEEQNYMFSDQMEPELLIAHSKIFKNLMKNPNTVKYIARNHLISLRYAFMAFSAASRGSQGVSESVSKDLLEGLGSLLKQKEPIQLINKNTYIANWYFYRMFEVLLGY